ncbi:MAG: methyltransferase domain-containing protein [Oscillospiraceae bacterium]|nr:methyltransferase domain-containing protein [Oscillospiraceae bacterium]
MRKTFNALDISKSVIAKKVSEGDICIDATAGRGNDTAFLCELAGKSGRVIAFDIQADAINSTRQLLSEKGLSDRAELVLGSHTDMDKYAAEGTVSCITFNFGWLPGGDHTVHTQKETSLEAVKKALRLIKKGGLISMILYYGRDTGFEEKEALLEFVKTIDSEEYTVITAEFSNRPNCPPIPIFILRE